MAPALVEMDRALGTRLTFWKVLLGLLALAGSGSAFFRLAGPYNVELKSLERCEDQGRDLLAFDTRLHMRSATEFEYSGPWRWAYDLDDVNWHVRLDAERWGTGGWCKNALSFDAKKPCSDALSLVGDMFRSLAKAAGFAPKCPVPKGNYTIQNWVVNMSLPFQQLLYGTYRIDTVFSYQGERVGCIRLQAEVTERSTRG